MPQRTERHRLLRRNVNRFRGGLVFKAHRLVYHSTLGLRVMKKKEEAVCARRSYAPSLSRIKNLGNPRNNLSACYTPALRCFHRFLALVADSSFAGSFLLVETGSCLLVGTGSWLKQRFRGGLVFKAHRLLYHSTLGLRVIKKKREGYLADIEVGDAHFLVVVIHPLLLLYSRYRS